MKVVKRNGLALDFDRTKIERRLQAISKDLTIKLDRIIDSFIQGATDTMDTTEIDEQLARIAATLGGFHPHYSELAGRILITKHQKESLGFVGAMKTIAELPREIDEKPILSENFMALVNKHGEELESYIDYSRDLSFDYFGISTLLKKYFLSKDSGKVAIPVERPQDLYMRVALALHKDNIQKVKRSYDILSEGYLSMATPTQTNAGTRLAQMSSCFLVQVKDDSIDGIYETLSDVAKISKLSGGIGLHCAHVRAKDSLIKSTQGRTTGIVPMARPYNETARYVNQGGKRKGALNLQMEIWHYDIEDVILAKRKETAEGSRLNDLFITIISNNVFMKRLKEDKDWSLFCPSEARKLPDLYGKEFEAEYLRLEEAGKARKTVKARDLFQMTLVNAFQTGGPFWIHKDHMNEKSNQKNLGTIKSSNLCVEIVQYSSPDEIAVCNLASLALPKFVKEDGTFDHELLEDVTYEAVILLDNVIDENYYPVAKARNSNMKHRPVGLGVQGLADVFMKMGLAYDSPEARKLNKEIFETMYYSALKSSLALARTKGAYSTFEGSPASQGKLQFDLWGVEPSDRHNWKSLKKEIIKHGLRNSLLIALMPTASSAQILGNTESMEPLTSNIYTREINGGQFIVTNKYFVEDMEKLGLWSDEMALKIIDKQGSVQDIDGIPDNIKLIYRTAYEIPTKSCLEMSADRGAFVCQSQSLNVFFKEPNLGKLSQAIMKGWELGLKTGMYYLRLPNEKSASIAADSLRSVGEGKKVAEAVMCSLDNPEGCDSCSA